MVWKVARAVRSPVIGMGGIMIAVDALEFMLAGTVAVQVGTGELRGSDVHDPNRGGAGRHSEGARDWVGEGDRRDFGGLKWKDCLDFKDWV